MSPGEVQAVVDLIDEIAHACDGRPYNIQAHGVGLLDDPEIAHSLSRLENSVGGMLRVLDDLAARYTNATGTIRGLSRDLETLEADLREFENG